MRRKPGSVLPLELSIVGALLELRVRGQSEAHGFLIAKEMFDRDGARLLIAHGTLYKALGRMERAGLLESRWEDPMLAADEGRPRRRFYQCTVAGEAAFAQAAADGEACSRGGAPRLGGAPS